MERECGDTCRSLFLRGVVTVPGVTIEMGTNPIPIERTMLTAEKTNTGVLVGTCAWNNPNLTIAGGGARGDPSFVAPDPTVIRDGAADRDAKDSMLRFGERSGPSL
ncbi:MAG TPA: hypothetical protein PK089_04800 [Methanoregulaceae archaeon]|nr:hypothetical protein [Methanoregulaceae archaeon]HQJ88749.1 hypothetical protein [Methanoregulaceae archaeon]